MRSDFKLRIVPAAILAALALLLTAQAGPERLDILIRGGTLLTMDGGGHVYQNGHVGIRDGRIVLVGSGEPRAARAGLIIDAAGKLIMPGLVNAHNHAPMTLFRGIADDLRLMEWLEKHIFPAEARFVDREFVRWGTLLACLEMIRFGTTTYADMYYFEDDIAEATAKAGMRGVLGETIIDFPSPDSRTPQVALAYAERFLKKWRGHRLITPAVAPHAAYTCSRATLVAARELADRYDAPLLIHMAEARAEAEKIEKEHGMSVVAYLKSLGLLGRRLVGAHGIWLSEADISLLKESGAGVAHCPESNMKLASGVSPVPRLLARGVEVGLGTDGAASNNNLDLFEEMDSAAKLHKLHSGDPTTLPARQVVEMATIGGARLLGLEKEIGSIEPGKRADVIILELNEPNLVPLYNIYSHLVYSAKGAQVTTTIIDGRLIMKDRRVLTLNQAEIFARAREYRDRVGKALGRGD